MWHDHVSTCTRTLDQLAAAAGVVAGNRVTIPDALAAQPRRLLGQLAELRTRYREVEGTLSWYCVDYWSEQLGLDIPLLKQEIEHLIDTAWKQHPRLSQSQPRVESDKQVQIDGRELGLGIVRRHAVE